MSTPIAFRIGQLSVSTGLITRLGLLVALIVLFAVLNPTFVSPRNLYALLQSFALLGLVALGLSLTMIAGEFDLSVGSMVAVGGLLTLIIGGQGLLPGLAAAIACGLAVGLFNATMVRWLKVSSLVVTLGMMMTLSGVAFWLAGGKVISTNQFDPGFMLDGRVLEVFSPRSLITLLIFLLVGLMMRFTLTGRDIRATGSKRAVAEASGAKVGRALTVAFVTSSCSAALAGSLLSMSLASAAATTASSIMLQAVSAAIVGGVALSGGSGSVFGVLLGSFVLAVMNNGLSLIGTGATGILFANGLVLMAVVLFDGRLGRWVTKQLSAARPSIPALRD